MQPQHPGAGLLLCLPVWTSLRYNMNQSVYCINLTVVQTLLIFNSLWGQTFLVVRVLVWYYNKNKYISWYWLQSFQPASHYHLLRCILVTCAAEWLESIIVQHVQLHSPNAQVTFHCNLYGRRDAVTIVTGYLRWGRRDPEAPLLPLSQLDPESKGEQRVRSRSLQAALNAIHTAVITAVK